MNVLFSCERLQKYTICNFDTPYSLSEIDEVIQNGIDRWGYSPIEEMLHGLPQCKIFTNLGTSLAAYFRTQRENHKELYDVFCKAHPLFYADEEMLVPILTERIAFYLCVLWILIQLKATNLKTRYIPNEKEGLLQIFI